MIREDPHKATGAEKKQAREVQARIMKQQGPLLLAYFRPGFHPWQIEDADLLRGWSETPGLPSQVPG
jgi:predicted metal-dependent hydrolase